MKTPKPKKGEKIFRCYWVTSLGESLVWAKDKDEALEKAASHDDFDYMETEILDAFIHEVVEPDDEGLEAQVLADIAEEEKEEAET